jgi:hypothetical protein
MASFSTRCAGSPAEHDLPNLPRKKQLAPGVVEPAGCQNYGRLVRFLRHAVLTIFVLVVVGATTALVMARRGGLAAHAEPGRLERSVAGPARAFGNPG